MNHTDELSTLLRQHYLFNQIDDERFAALVARVRPVALETGDILFHQEQAAERFYLIRQGQIKLSRISPAGQEKVIEIMNEGNTFAEAVMFMERKHYPVTAQALVPSTVYAIPNEAFLSMLRNNTELCFRLLGDVSVRLHSLLQELDSLAQQNASYRLIHYLLSQLPPDCGPQADVELDVPKQVLASRLSIKPESLSRLLHNFSEQGILSVEKTRVRINDIDRLRTLSESA